MKNRTRNNQSNGFSLVEMLTVVAIIVILLAISAVSVVRYIDILKITELDNAARDIYMAAENRAVLLSGAQQLDKLVPEINTVTVTTSAVQTYDVDNDENVKTETLYYASKEEVTAKGLLADKSIDPALLDGDFYIVYDLASGSVREVFYAEKDKKIDGGALDALVKANEGFGGFYTDWTQKDRSTRLGWKNGTEEVPNPNKTLVGRYSGEAAGSTDLKTEIQEKPYIDVMIENKEELTVTVTVKWDKSIDKAVRKAIAEGNLSVKLDGTDIDLAAYDYYKATADGGRVTYKTDLSRETSATTYKCIWVLDSLANENLKFAKFQERDSDIIPGKDFTVKATIKPVTDELEDLFIKAEAKDTDNSLFEYKPDGASDGNTAHIAYLRHLQNLSAGNGYNSGVGNGKTSAIQTADILGGADNEVYKTHKFVPIFNSALTSYTGNDGTNQYEIRNLTLKASNAISGYTYAGLFLETKKEGMSLSNIRMVNTKTEDANASYAGALVGKAYNTAKIEYCWAYWDESRLPSGKLKDAGVLGSDNNLKYQLQGVTVGGLVGVVEKYEAGGAAVVAETPDAMIDHCLAATLINGSSNAGGLVGEWDSSSTGSTPDISHSYADCYLKGGNVAGLVGNVKGTVKLTDCYAAGFIMENPANSAGLSLGTGTTTPTNVYSVMLLPVFKDGKVSEYKTPDSLTGKLDEDFDGKNVHLLGEGKYGKSSSEMDSGSDFLTTMSNGRSGVFEWKKPEAAAAALDPDPTAQQPIEELALTSAAAAANADGSYPYELLKDLDGYVYPGLSGLPHYGDWDEVDLKKVVGFVYYEQYSDGTLDNVTWGIEGYNFDGSEIKKDLIIDTKTKTIQRDGYALAVKQSNLANADNITIKYTVSQRTPQYAPFSSIKENKATGVTLVNDDGSEEEIEVYLIFLDDILVKDAEPVADFYEYLSIELYKGSNETAYADKGEYFFNPHFAKTVRAPADWYEGETPTGEEKDSTITDLREADEAIFIRTPRHLYDLSQSATYYHKEYQFQQELNLALGETAPGFYKTYISGLKPIGRYQVKDGSFDGSDSFVGTYEGGNHNISGLSISGTGDHANYVGLFGCNTGIIQNLTVTSGSISGGTAVGGIVGYNNGTVTGCATGAGFSVTGTSSVGGIVGSNGGEVLSCTNGGTVGTEKTGANIGGIVGSNSGKVGFTVEGSTETAEPCENGGAVYGNISVGGIVGENAAGAVVKNSTNGYAGSVSGSEAVGGVVGANSGIVDGTTIDIKTNKEDMSNSESSSVRGSKHIGGIVGYNRVGGTVKMYKATTDSSAMSGDENVGGIVGWNEGGTVQDCKSVTWINAGSATNVGGIVGYNTAAEVKGDDGKTTTVAGSVEGCTNGHRVTGGTAVGGIMGRNDGGEVTNCTNETSGNVTGQQYAGGIVGYNTAADAEVTGCQNKGAVSAERQYTLGQTVYIQKDYYAGGIVGYNDAGTVTGCTNSAEGTLDDRGYYAGGGIVGAGYVGGIVGWNENGTVQEGCSNTGLVYAYGDVGGIVGYNNGADAEVSDCDNSGTVTSDRDGKRVGGVVGKNISGTVKNCGNTGDVDGGEQIGGIVGYNEEGTIDGCKNTDGTLTATVLTGPANLGGIVGSNAGGEVLRCYNEADITYDMGEGQGVGGIAGVNNNTYDNPDYYEGGNATGEPKKYGEIQYCYNTGEVSSSGSQVGGIVGNGQVNSKITSCYNTGDVTGVGTGNNSYVGGIVGGCAGIKIQNCYNIGKISSSEGDTAWGDILGGVRSTGPVTIDMSSCYYLNRNNYAADYTGMGEGENAITTTVRATPLNKEVTGNDNNSFTNKNIFTSNGWGFDEVDGPWVMCIDKKIMNDSATLLPKMRPGLKNNLEKGLAPTDAPAHAEFLDTTAFWTEMSKLNGDGDSSQYQERYFVLTEDIDLTLSEKTLEAIGGANNGHAFDSTFDGNGFTITLGNDQYLFGKVGSAGIIKNLRVAVKNPNEETTGGIVREKNEGGTVENCYYNGEKAGGETAINNGPDSAENEIIALLPPELNGPEDPDGKDSDEEYPDGEDRKPTGLKSLVRVAVGQIKLRYHV